MMLFNIKQCRWRSVARREFEQRSESLLGMESQMVQNSPGFHRRVIIKTPFS